MMHLLHHASPSFEAAWRRYLEEQSEDERLLYVELGEFARHLVGLLERGNQEELNAVFEVIERLYIEGDADVKQAATVGLLEGLQNGSLHRHTTPEQFRRYLRPVSEQWWDKLYRFWDHGELLQ